MDGFNNLGVHHADGQQTSPGGHIALVGVAPQRVPAPAVHVKHQPTDPLHLHTGLDVFTVFEYLRAPARRRMKLGFYPLPGHAPQIDKSALAPGIGVSVESITGVFPFR